MPTQGPSSFTPQATRRDPSVLSPGMKGPSPTPQRRPDKPGGGSQLHHHQSHTHGIPNENERSCCKKFLNFLYNSEKGTYCGRTCLSWFLIIAYSIMYLMFLVTYTQFFLYGSLEIIKKQIDDPDKNTFSSDMIHDVGLTATPTSENSYSMIWYRSGEPDDYDKYVKSIDGLIMDRRRRRKRDLRSDLGPCGQSPYGYGDRPCVLVRINKRVKWSAKPLQEDSPNAKNAPELVKKWMKRDKKKLWLHCDGYHSYDKEHLGNIRYYPDPPGYDADLYPMQMDTPSPLVAIQIYNFTIGLSLAVKCDLWYDSGSSSVEFLLYVAPKSKLIVR